MQGGRHAHGQSPGSKKRAATGLLSLKVTLRDIRPPVWRRIAMAGTMTLEDLHLAIQAVMGWDNCHLHEFGAGGVRYGDPGTTDDVANECRITLNRLVKSGVNRFRYTYDFGDGWEHDILSEKAPPANDAKAFPACVADKRACPPEDCGGAGSYENLLDILANPDDPNRAERLEWSGGAFDPEAFPVAAADAALAAVFGRTVPPA